MSRWHNYYPDSHAFFCTYSVASRSAVLGEAAAAIIWAEWEKARAALGVDVLAYCIMPDHVHLVLWSEVGNSVRAFLHRTIAQTSRRLSPGGGFWKERPRVVPIYSRRVLDIKVNYIHANPVRRELVALPEQWPQSSYRQLIQAVRLNEEADRALDGGCHIVAGSFTCEPVELRRGYARSDRGRHD